MAIDGLVFSHRNLFEQALGFILLVRPYRCNACMRRFWWFAWKQRDVQRHRNSLVLAGIAFVVLLGGFVYLKTLPYETELPRQPGERPPPVVEPASLEATATGEATVLQGDHRVEDGLETEESVLTPLTEAGEPAPPSLPPASPFQASALRDSGELLDIHSVADGGQLHILLQTDAPPRTFQYFMLSAPERLVIDIQGGWTTGLPSALPLAHPLTGGLRVGRHQDMVRVVIQLDRGIMLPEVEVRSDGLALTLRPGN